QHKAKPPQSDTERSIAKVWETLFRPQPVSVDDDFFQDLGGHSLLVARMVSELRKDPRFARVAVRDVYEHPTIASLAASANARSAEASAVAGAKTHDPRERRRHFLAGVLQAAGLYFQFGFRGVQWVTPDLVYFFLVADGHSPLASAGWAGASAVAIFPLLLIVAVMSKWLVLGRVQSGRYPLWGWYHLRWWFVQTTIAGLPLDYLAGTPLLPFVYRLFGAQIGRDVHIATERLAAFDLISIGDEASIDDDASLFGY